MLNRTVLESAHQELLSYREKLTTALEAIALFLGTPDPAAAKAVDVQTASATSATHTGVTVPAPVVATASTPPAAARGKKASRATQPPDTTAHGQRVLSLLAKQSPRRPSDLVEVLQCSALTLRTTLAALEADQLVEVTGATISRRVAITDRGRAWLAKSSAAQGTAPAPTEADVVAARDKAIKDRLKAGAATFEQLLAELPGEFPSADAKTNALKASLRRLTLRSEVLDAGNQFKLRAA